MDSPPQTPAAYAVTPCHPSPERLDDTNSNQSSQSNRSLGNKQELPAVPDAWKNNY